MNKKTKDTIVVIGSIIIISTLVYLAYKGWVTSTDNPDVAYKNLPTDSVPATTQTNPLLQTPHNTYTNTYHDYTLAYPQSWSMSGAPANNDGARFYAEDPSADIRVFASVNDDSDFNNPEFMRSTLLLDNGKTADMVQGTENGQHILKVVVSSSDGTNYQFYASTTQKFFEHNNQLLLEVARTLDTQ